MQRRPPPPHTPLPPTLLCAPPQERTFLGVSLKRAEQALAVHAEQVTQELGACVQDITALFARVGEVGAFALAVRGVLLREPLCEARGQVRGASAQRRPFSHDALQLHAGRKPVTEC